MEDIKVFFSTLYAFSEAAKQQLANAFTQSDSSRAVLLGNPQTTQFVLRFQKDDKHALSTFGSIVKHYVAEKGTELSDQETHLLRLKDTGLTIDESVSDAEERTTNDIEAAPTVATEITKHWPGGLDAGLTRKIGDVTGCTILQKLDGSGLLVKGATTFDLGRAFTKLEVFSATMHQRTSFPVARDFLISEAEINIMLQMIRLRNLNDRRLATTLVPIDVSKRLENQLTVVMLKSNQVYPDFISIKHKRPFEVESLLWKNVPYEPIGPSEVLLPFTEEHGPDLEVSPHHAGGRYGRTVAEWVDESTAAGPANVDPFVPLPDEQVKLQDNVESSQKISSPPRKRPVKGRKAKGASAEPAIAKPIDGNLVSGTTILNRMEETSRSSHSSNTIDLEEVRTPFKTSAGSVGYEEVTPSMFPSIDNTFGIKSSYAAELAQLQILEAPKIQAPYMPARSTTSGFTGKSISPQPSWAHARVSGVKEGNLIDILTSEPAKEERKRSNSIAAIGPGNKHRAMKSTMTQRKAASQMCPVQREAGMLKQYDDVALQLLSMARSTPGYVKIEAQLGRLMIDYQSGTDEFKKRPFAVGEWSRVFPSVAAKVKLESIMTERLTSSGSDADLIWQLKHASGCNMFTPEPHERVTFYRFKCISTLFQGTIVIDINEDKACQVRDADILVGALGLHFPKRYWDARIAVIVNDLPRGSHQDVAQCIADNLRVNPAIDHTHIDLFVKTNPKVFTIQSIEVHRVTRQRSTQYPDLLLKLSEVQDLVFEADGGQDYHAWTKSKKEMANEGRLWWEVALTSVAAENMLKENEALEIGETSEWQGKDIVDASIVRNMYHLAYAIATNIDSVGYHNKGPKTESSKKQSEKGFKTLGYW